MTFGSKERDRPTTGLAQYYRVVDPSGNSRNQVPQDAADQAGALMHVMTPDGSYPLLTEAIEDLTVAAASGLHPAVDTVAELTTLSPMPDDGILVPVTNDPSDDGTGDVNGVYKRKAAAPANPPAPAGWVKTADRITQIRNQQLIDGRRITDLENDSLPVDFGATDQFEIINTSISNPSTRYNWSVVDGKLVIDQTASVLLLIGFLTNYTGIENRSFSCRYVVDAVDAASGFGICINPSGGSVIDPTNHVSIIWRASNGLILAYRQDGSTVVASLTAPGAGSGVVIDASVPRVSWTTGDVLDMTLVLDADGTTGAFTTFKNGAVAASFRVVGLPVGYIGATGRHTTSGITGTFGPVLVSRIQQAAKRIYINPNVGASSIGTEANPFKTISDGLLYVNESGRRLDMVLKGGVYLAGPEIQTNRYDSIRIVGDQGKRPLIRPGTVLTSGWGLAGGSSKVYARSHVFGGTTGALNASGAFLDLSNHDGDWGFTFYERQPPLTGSVAALEALATGVGGYWIDAATGIAYIKCIGNVSPNTLQIFRAEWTAGVNLMPAPAILAGMTDIYIAGLDIEMPYAHGILAGRVRGVIEDCFVKGVAALNAFSPNMMTGEIASCRGWRCWNDGINHTVPLDFADPNPSPERIAQLRVIGCDMTDMAVGDGLSNHSSQDVVVIGGSFSRNGKCGIVPVANATIVGAQVSDNATEGIGVLVSNAPGAASAVVSVRDCHLSGNAVGFSAVTPDVNGDSSQNTAVLEVLGGTCIGSTEALFRLRNDSPTGGTSGNPCTISARNLARSGNTVYRDDITGAHGQLGHLVDVVAPIMPGAF
ncbi:hypothetical protein FFK22_008760 [Mycobacterium sp. KBS0706]|uniref:hypothetical protein n=1 Tax=Mycobacterium sp. KBS0706 TaxID=2578109 RepID=UPI00110F840E|nr:hypothetical protein [Mycobacterium sp. KBS0706]TSD89063.1 hypothetical protein FFK22_008760 [Mycobacterium sp. KBS0706]